MIKQLLRIISASATIIITLGSALNVLDSPTHVSEISKSNLFGASNAYYVSSSNGSDGNPGTEAQPWQTMKKAFRSLHAGDMLYMRAGVYETHWRSGQFDHSGTAQRPITVTNYPGEQVEIRVTDPRGIGWEPFMCWADGGSRPTPKIDYIRIIGTDVEPRTLSNGVTSEKGIVLRGMIEEGMETYGVWGAGDCNYWEIAGIDFIDLGGGVWTRKMNNQTTHDYSPDNWWVHDNRVYRFWWGPGMQFNGNYALVENNQIYKVTSENKGHWSCNHINLLGHHNIVRNNDLQAMGSSYGCVGVLFEWDISDYNIVENNRIAVQGWGGGGYVNISGGDNNIIRNNTIIGDLDEWLYILGERQTTDWPCNELTHATQILPANDPAAPDYQYFYNPRKCTSEGNLVHDNTYDHSGNNTPIPPSPTPTDIPTQTPTSLPTSTPTPISTVPTSVTNTPTDTVLPTTTNIPTQVSTSSPSSTPTPLPTATIPTVITDLPLDTTPPTITNIDIVGNGENDNRLLITFSEDVGATGSDTTNFILSGASTGTVFIDSINYDSGSYTTTLNINGGNPLPPDNYTLTVIGQTSIKDIAGNRLDGNADGNAGDDFVLNFPIQPPAPASEPTVCLYQSDGQTGIAGGVVKYYSAGWKTFGTTGPNGCISKGIPVRTYQFRMIYANADVRIRQDLDSNPVVIFRTTRVTVKMIDSVGNPLDTGAVQFYSRGWQNFGITSNGEVSKELLPKTYTFRMTYLGRMIRIKQNVTANPIILFQTGQVVSGSGAATGFYSRGWKPFANGMELLPGTYKFRFNNNTPVTKFIIYGGVTNTIY